MPRSPIGKCRKHDLVVQDLDAPGRPSRVDWHELTTLSKVHCLYASAATGFEAGEVVQIDLCDWERFDGDWDQVQSPYFQKAHD